MIRAIMQATSKRDWCVRWLYTAAAAHLMGGLALPWVMQSPLLDSYHRGIEAAFWHGALPSIYAAAARAQQNWWIALLGATLQNLALYMAALIRIGDRQHSAFAWGALAVGIIVWAPQDMAISLQADCWPHVWIDLCALSVLLPPMFWLWHYDYRNFELGNAS